MYLEIMIKLKLDDACLNDVNELREVMEEHAADACGEFVSDCGGVVESATSSVVIKRDNGTIVG